MVCVTLFAIAAAASGDDFPDPLPSDREGPGRLDPNRAPLPLLALAPGVGKEGAMRIGEARGSLPIRDAGDLRVLLGEPGAFDEGDFLFPGEREGAFSIRYRSERSESGGVRETRAFEYRRGAWEGGVLAERDPGEHRVDDFLSWSVLADLRGGSVRIAAGDIAVRLGSGLLIGTFPPFGTPSDFSPYPRSRLSRYRSRMENEAHRGAAARFPLGGGTAWLLLTDTARDARIDDAGRVSSLDDAGLHRTALEKSRRDALREGIAGARWERTAGPLETGFTAAAAGYDPPLGGGDLTRKPDAFAGTRLAAAALDLRYGDGPLLVQAEGGRSDAGGSGGRALLRLALEKTRLLLRFRNYAGRFHAPRSVAESRIGSEPAGEIGWIAMADRRIGAVRAEVRFHRYASFARTWNSAGPVAGDEYAARIEGDRGAFSWRVAAGGASRSEVRGGSRVLGGSGSLAAGLSRRWRRGHRLAADFRWGASRTPGGDRVRTGAGLSLLLTLQRGRDGRIDLSWVHLFREDRALALPSPSLPGSMPFGWYGGGRARGGFRIARQGWGTGPLTTSLAAGPEGISFECLLRRPARENPR